MYTENKEILVLGLGNILMQDEGVGVRAVEALECRYIVPDCVTLMDGGTTGTELLQPMRGVKQLIVADAIHTGDANGTLVRIADEQVPAFFQTKLSNHQLGLSDLLALLSLTDEQPEHVTIVGLVPHSLENRLGLTPEAEQGVEAMVAQLVVELERLGVELVKRAQPLRGFWQQQAALERVKCA
ncbi:Hydrogenase 2 maturation peptidase, Aspartic peptidase, MEROPS family A31 [Magnetococcus marinus MC-1]|uniref:Hydrogenase 2 maturation peptidase, Aspartic peptidase, MEROPS family A31 n=1 Tax=Magnetococcus marinus (strain ATCC BAA-1437 / JCM 17883 / MC-1) TaxID=156889 RepID=A0LAK9_MAGMM|nr:HyaD/HybD family hydrogenase maturation endopeptidase [Magnetococcus marinus]ABK45002.1 Hydrogenase 2 maturation peptidase, Aspartic peptidase, MEROPS family A31 [Magnetococcus marinus MC-1]